ncbi:MAG: fimbrillin family protein [Bacteroidales bacterium]|nr:fimbrillin family protein [Bacteroidales bacterium]
MKKYLICAVAVLAACSLTGCKDEGSAAPESEILISVSADAQKTRSEAGDRQMDLTFLSEDGHTVFYGTGTVSALPDAAGPDTKSGLYTTDGLTQFGVDAYLTTEVTGVATHYIDNGQADKTDAGWTLSNPTDQTGYKWVHNQTISFWAHAPYNWLEAVSGAAYQLSNVAVASDYASLSFDYSSSSFTFDEAGDAAYAAPDILIAHTAASSMNGKVNFSFGHVFSGIRFDIAESLSANYDLVAIDLLNIAGDGTCTVAADGTVTWGDATGTVNLRQEVLDEGIVFFVRPQTLGTNAKVTVTLNSKTAPVTTLQVTASLAEMELKNGELNAFNVGFYANGFDDVPEGHQNAQPWSVGDYTLNMWKESDGATVSFWLDGYAGRTGNLSLELVDGALVVKSQDLEHGEGQFHFASGRIEGLTGGDFDSRGWLQVRGVPFMRLVRTGENTIKFVPETYTYNGVDYTFSQFGILKADGSSNNTRAVDLPIVAGPED